MAAYLGPSARLLHFETRIAIFVEISKKLLLFCWKGCIFWEIYKFATFSINYVKLELFNQLLESQLIVANILVSLDCLNMLTIKYLTFLIYFRNIAVLIFLVSLRCANSFVKIYDLMSVICEVTKTNAFSFYKTYIFELKLNFAFKVTKKMAIQFNFLSKTISY